MSQAALAMPVLLERLAAALDVTAQEVDNCQTCTTGQQYDPETIRQLQALDAASQTLHAVARILKRSAAQLPDDTHISISLITEGVGLANLVKGLVEGKMEKPQAEDLELF